MIPVLEMIKTTFAFLFYEGVFWETKSCWKNLTKKKEKKGVGNLLFFFFGRRKEGDASPEDFNFLQGSFEFFK